MTTYITADHHFNHSRIIELCQRPYTSVDEMNADMVAKWNAVVGPTDSVWHLGDFCWKGYESVFTQLNGQKHLIIGNHDPQSTLMLPWASPPQVYQELKIKEDGITTRVVLFHYGIRSWNGMFRGVLHLHGHSHGKLPGSRLSLDIGVDCWDFSPVTLPQIKARMATLPEANPELG